MNLTQWVKASVFRFLKNEGLTNILPVGFYQDAPEALNAGELERIELRLNGPHTRNIGLNDRHDFDINLLLTAQQTNNVYAFDRFLDRVANAVKDTICIFKIDEDNQIEPFELVGPLKIYKSLRFKKNVHNFGLIEANRQLYQGVVSAKYYIDLPKE